MESWRDADDVSKKKWERVGGERSDRNESERVRRWTVMGGDWREAAAASTEDRENS